MRMFEPGLAIFIFCSCYPEPEAKDLLCSVIA